ncbi:MAG TPA: hypothetical protein VHW66_21140 [Stellaceae bacterium]|jgi:hypothetical protein|nr:hypothetical protein [Stellaceae bacterium]
MGWARLIVWVPTAAVVAMTAIACVLAMVLPERPTRRRFGVLVAAWCGAAAIIATVWQQSDGAADASARRGDAAANTAQQAKYAARLKTIWQKLDTAAKPLPPAADKAPPASFDTVDAGLTALSAQADDLGKRVTAFKAGAQAREVDDATADQMVAYLKQQPAHGRVVVSCLPQDDEAYLYANRLATILRQAGWDATGPEFTAIFGTTPSLAISLYARGGEPPDAAHVLIDAFTRFNIPYQGRIAASDAIPDNETVELFVAKKP